ncbi:MAG: protein kinase [Gemmatimonadaceae bacterium]
MTAILDRLSSSLHDRYVIERELGQGGMATVYLALDRRHERRVAIKVLHPELSAVLGAERFLSEIKLTASLQHPHILPLFDSGVADGLVYYVMPFVEGETLRGKLERERQLSVSDSVRLATEIADALQYAHDRGVIHRDIKPENVLLQNGHAIVADFGIALAVQHAGGTRMTQTGMSLGTPQYMAPEQAMGEKNVDARADVYALGAVTYEMLAGEPPFTGPTAQSIVARVMTERSRPLRIVRDTVPPNVEHAVATALEKLPADRMPTAQAFAEGLRNTGSFGATSMQGAIKAPNSIRGISTRFAVALTAVGIVSGLIVAFVYSLLRGTSVQTNTAELAVSFEVMLPDSVKLRLVCCGQLFAISPNGRWVVFQGTPHTAAFSDSSSSDYQLYLRDLTDLSVRPLPDTRNVQGIFFSPDNEEIAFSDGKQLKRLKLSGSATQVVGTLPAGFVGGGTWSKDGTIYFATSGKMLHGTVNSGSLDSLFYGDTVNIQFSGPFVVDNPHVMLYTEGKFGKKARVMWRSLTTGKSHEVAIGATPTYIAAQHVLLLVRSDKSLMQYPFDIATGDTTGPPVRIASDVSLRSPLEFHAEYSASPAGTIVLAAREGGEGVGGMSLVDLSNGAPKVRRVMPTYNHILTPGFSLDGQKISLLAAQQAGNLVAFVYYRGRDAATRLNAPASVSSMAILPSGDSVVYAGGTQEFFMAATDGSGALKRVLKLSDWVVADEVVALSGPWIAFTGVPRGSNAPGDVVVVNRDSGGKATPYAANPTASETFPQISPDGKWMSYASDEAGGSSVYVSAFPIPAGHFLVSPNGGAHSHWSADSRTLYFNNGSVIYASTFTPGVGSAAPVFGSPKEIYRRDPWGAFDMAYDGKTLAFIDRVREGSPRSLVVRLHAVTVAKK